MLEMAGGNLDAVTCEIVGRAYDAGDSLAKEILLETVELVTIWLGNILDLLEPDVIIMGGGVAPMLKPFFGEIQRALPAWCMNKRCVETQSFPHTTVPNPGSRVARLSECFPARLNNRQRISFARPHKAGDLAALFLALGRTISG